MQIEMGLNQAWTVAQIAEHTGFSRSSIYREINRHSVRAKKRWRQRYSARVGQHNADRNRSRSTERKLEEDCEVREVVADLEIDEVRRTSAIALSDHAMLRINVD